MEIGEQQIKQLQHEVDRLQTRVNVLTQMLMEATNDKVELSVAATNLNLELNASRREADALRHEVNQLQTQLAPKEEEKVEIPGENGIVLAPGQATVSGKGRSRKSKPAPKRERKADGDDK